MDRDKYEFRITEQRFQEAITIVAIGAIFSPNADDGLIDGQFKKFIDLLFVATYCTYDNEADDYVDSEEFTPILEAEAMSGMLDYAIEFISKVNDMLGIPNGDGNDPRLEPYKKFLEDKL